MLLGGIPPRAEPIDRVMGHRDSERGTGKSGDSGTLRYFGKDYEWEDDIRTFYE